VRSFVTPHGAELVHKLLLHGEQPPQLYLALANNPELSRGSRMDDAQEPTFDGYERLRIFPREWTLSLTSVGSDGHAEPKVFGPYREKQRVTHGLICTGQRGGRLLFGLALNAPKHIWAGQQFVFEPAIRVVDGA